MGAVIIAFAIVAVLLTGVSYYLVLPFAYNAKASFAAGIASTDPQALAFGEVLYDVVGIFPLIFFGAIALNSMQKSVRDSNSDIQFD